MRRQELWSRQTKWGPGDEVKGTDLRDGFLFSYIFIFWLCWVFVAAYGLSLVAVSRDYCSLHCTGLSLWWFLLLRSTGSRHMGFSSCGMQVQ